MINDIYLNRAWQLSMPMSLTMGLFSSCTFKLVATQHYCGIADWPMLPNDLCCWVIMLPNCGVIVWLYGCNLVYWCCQVGVVAIADESWVCKMITRILLMTRQACYEYWSISFWNVGAFRCTETLGRQLLLTSQCAKTLGWHLFVFGCAKNVVSKTSLHMPQLWSLVLPRFWSVSTWAIHDNWSCIRINLFGFRCIYILPHK